MQITVKETSITMLRSAASVGVVLSVPVWADPTFKSANECGGKLSYADIENLDNNALKNAGVVAMHKCKKKNKGENAVKDCGTCVKNHMNKIAQDFEVVGKNFSNLSQRYSVWKVLYAEAVTKMVKGQKPTRESVKAEMTKELEKFVNEHPATIAAPIKDQRAKAQARQKATARAKHAKDVALKFGQHLLAKMNFAGDGAVNENFKYLDEAATETPELEVGGWLKWANCPRQDPKGKLSQQKLIATGDPDGTPVKGPDGTAYNSENLKFCVIHSVEGHLREQQKWLAFVSGAEGALNKPSPP